MSGLYWGAAVPQGPLMPAKAGIQLGLTPEAEPAVMGPAEATPTSWPGSVPAIHETSHKSPPQSVDARDTRGHDEGKPRLVSRIRNSLPFATVSARISDSTRTLATL